LDTQALPASYCVFAWHYYCVFFHYLADQAFLFAVLIGFAIVGVELALVDEVGAELELALILE
jgi:hypothetical protein